MQCLNVSNRPCYTQRTALGTQGQEPRTRWGPFPQKQYFPDLGSTWRCSPLTFKRRRQWIWLGADPTVPGTENLLTAISLRKRGEGSGGLTSWQKASPVSQHRSLSVQYLAPLFCLLWVSGRKSFGLTAPRGRSVLQPRRTGVGSGVCTEPLKSGSNILQSLWKPTGVLCIATVIHINPEHFAQVHTVGSLQSYK